MVDLRSTLMTEIENGFQNDTRPDDHIVFWYLALGTLSWEVAGSIYDLLTTKRLRTAHLLNRCLFEYAIRLKFYNINRDQCDAAITRLPIRLKVRDAVIRSMGDDKMTPEDRREAEEYFKSGRNAHQPKIAAMMAGVESQEFADRHGPFYYEGQGAYVHGYENILYDFFYDYLTTRQKILHLDPPSKVLNASWVAIKAIESVHDMIEEIRSIRNLSVDYPLRQRWKSIMDEFRDGDSLKYLSEQY